MQTIFHRVLFQEKDVELGKLAIYHGMQQSYYSSHLVGMKTLKELRDNLDISTNGLNKSELSALDEVKQRFVITGIQAFRQIDNLLSG